MTACYYAFVINSPGLRHYCLKYSISFCKGDKVSDSGYLEPIMLELSNFMDMYCYKNHIFILLDRYKAPEGFEEAMPIDSDVLSVDLQDQELYLIKAPLNVRLA